MSKKTVTILISLLLCAFAVMEICIGHTVGRGRHYFASRDPVGFWISVGFLVVMAVVVFCFGLRDEKDDSGGDDA